MIKMFCDTCLKEVTRGYTLRAIALIEGKEYPPQFESFICKECLYHPIRTQVQEYIAALQKIGN